jgi:hypothetical protein
LPSTQDHPIHSAHLFMLLVFTHHPPINLV